MHLFFAALLTISNDKPLELISGWDQLIAPSEEYSEAIASDQPLLFSEDQKMEIQLLTQEIVTDEQEWDGDFLDQPEELSQKMDGFSSLKREVYMALKSQGKEEKAHAAVFHPTLEGSTTLAQTHFQLVDNPVSQTDQKAIDYYAHLIITDHQKGMIDHLLTNLAEKSKVVLLWQQGKMEKLGKQINAVVHPMRFLGTVFTDHKLIWCMRQIRKDYWKMKKFIEGFSLRMKHEADDKNLVKYIPGFAAAVNADEDKITDLIEKRDYEKLVIFLLELHK